ncbi:MAG TPA: ABC transporter permease [Terracidiphilus sp.]|jgi:predicted permease|nr:ABC transporter permease [Terracidiphilus sp.]
MKTPMWRRYARIFGADARADVKDELRFHLESKTEELVGRGWTPGEARQEAERQFGDMSSIQRIGERWGKRMERKRQWKDRWADMVQDLRYTVRTLKRDAGFTAVAVGILMLAVGANVAVFSVVNTVMLRPLPFAQPQQLVWIAPPPQKCGMSCSTYSSDAFDEFRAETRSYQDVTGYFAFSTADNLRLTGHGDPVPATGIDVIANFFQVLRVQPEMGRLFTPADARNNAPPVVLLTDAWWKRQFAGDKSIVGKTIDLNGGQTTVIGVLPKSFDFGAVFAPGAKVDALTPLNLDQARNEGNIVTFIGRLKPGVTVAQARAEADVVSRDLYFEVRYPESKGNYKGAIVPVQLKEYVTGRLRRSLAVLWSAVGMILLIACVNLSNLLLARATSRSKEFAMRGALGASRIRIVRQLLTESLVLSGVGSALGLGVAAGLLAWLSHQRSLALPLFNELGINGPVVGWTVAMAVVAAVLFGLLPGLRISGGNLNEALKDTGAGSGMGRKHERLRSVLVVTEVALAFVLLVGAGLLLRSFMKVLEVDLGFQPAHAAAVSVLYDDSAANNAASAEKRGVIFSQILERVSALPGVEAAGMVDYLPLGQNRAWGAPAPEGKTYKPGEAPSPLVYVVTPGYFRAMGMRVGGRDFAWSDGPHNEEVVLINRAAAQFYWPGQDAVGRILVNGRTKERVIGVVDDMRGESVEGPAGYQIYFSAMQEGPNGAELVVRTQMNPAALEPDVMKTLRALNPRQPVAEFVPIQKLVDHSVSPRRFFMMLVAAFGMLGLLLAALGIYGVISYSVTRRTQEIGIRMALGSPAGRVLRWVLFGTLQLTLAGIALGLGVSLAVARLIAAMLFGTAPWDAATFVSMVVALLMVALLAGYVPARRASRINPMVALRGN